MTKHLSPSLCMCMWQRTDAVPPVVDTQVCVQNVSTNSLVGTAEYIAPEVLVGMCQCLIWGVSPKGLSVDTRLSWRRSLSQTHARNAGGLEQTGA